MPSFLFAVDSFKGSISSRRAETLLGESVRRIFSQAVFCSVPIADGGEGSLEVVRSTCSVVSRTCIAQDPLGEDIEVSYLMSGSEAFIEMATICGLNLMSKNQRNPLMASSFGLGQVIYDAVDQGSTVINIFAGGTATNDCGLGAMRALGYRFCNNEGRELTNLPLEMGEIEQIEFPPSPILQGVSFRVIVDVNAQLTGTYGATKLYAPQKGATLEMLDFLERSFVHFSSVVKRICGIDISREQGLGAAGGFAAGAKVFLGAKVIQGIDYLLNITNFDEYLASCDICITGEGHIDTQTRQGKVVSGIARRCLGKGVPCLAIVGGMDREIYSSSIEGVSVIVPCVSDACTVHEALCHAEENFSAAADRMFSLIKLGMSLKEINYDTR